MSPSVRVVAFPDGVAIHGEFPSAGVLSAITRVAAKLPLVIADPPYGNIVSEAWDRIDVDDRGVGVEHAVVRTRPAAAGLRAQARCISWSRVR